MRKLDKKNLLLLTLPIVFIIAIVGLSTWILISAETKDIFIDSKSIIYNQYDERFEFPAESTVKVGWNGKKIVSDTEQATLNENDLIFTPDNAEAIILSDSVLINLDNSFENIKMGSSILRQSDGYQINGVVYEPGTVVKVKDRTYLILGNATVDDYSFSNYTLVYLDVAGNPSLYTNQQLVKFTENKILEIEGGIEFDLGMELLTLDGETVIDLTKVQGTSNKYAVLNSSGIVSDGSGSGESGGTDGTGSGSSSSSASGGGGGGEDVIITEDQYEGLLNKKEPSGSILGFNSITATTANVDVNYADSSGALVAKPSIVVTDLKGNDVFSAIVQGATIQLVGLKPNTPYLVRLEATFDIGEGVEKKTMGEESLITRSISSKIVIDSVKKDGATISVKINDDINLDQATLLLEVNNGGAWSDEHTEKLNVEDLVSASGARIVLRDLSANTPYRITLIGTVYNGVNVDVIGEVKFRTLKSTTTFKMTSFAQDETRGLKLRVETKEKLNNEFFEYSVYDVGTNQLHTYNLSTKQEQFFNSSTGLIPNDDYYAKVAILDADGNVKDEVITEAVYYETDFKVNDIHFEKGEHFIEFKTIPYIFGSFDVVVEARPELTSYLNSGGNIQEYDLSFKEIERDRRAFYVGSKIVIPIIDGVNEYRVLIEKSGEVLFYSSEFEYSHEQNANYLFSNNVVVEKEGDLFSVYDRHTTKLIEGVRDEHVEDYCLVGDVLFLVSDKMVITFLADDKDLFEKIDYNYIESYEFFDEYVVIELNSIKYRVTKNGLFPY